MHDHRHRLALLLAAALLAGVAAWAGPALADEAGASPTPAVATLADGTTESTATATATATDGATDAPTPGDGGTGGATGDATATATASDEATATETVTPTDTPTTEVPSPTVTPTPIPDPDPSFRPQAGLSSSNPYADGDLAQRGWVNQLNDLIQNAPTGSTIRIMVMTLSIQDTIDRLLAADARGVNVRIVLPLGFAKKERIAPLKSQLGRDVSKRSWITFCNGACYRGGDAGVMHAKQFLFSQTGAARNVFMITGGNLDSSHYRIKYNDAWTVVGDSVAYAKEVKFFDGMKVDHKAAVPEPFVSNGIKYYFFPRAGTNVFSRVLNATTCKGVTGDAGTNGRTVVRMVTSLWDSGRIGVARRLIALSRAGCDVRVTVQSYRTTQPVLTLLRNSHIKIRKSDTVDYTKGNHSKYLAVSGNVLGDRSDNTVVTGSVNLTPSDSVGCTNNMIRIIDSRSAFLDYSKNFDRIWSTGRSISEAAVAAAPAALPQGAAAVALDK